MGVAEESRGLWFSPRRRAVGDREKDTSTPKSFFSTASASTSWGEDSKGSDDSDREDGFDPIELADSLEKGLSRESATTEFMVPLTQTDNLVRYTVMRSEDSREYRLFSDSLDFLLYARMRPAARRIDIFCYDPQEAGDNLFDSSRPAFTLTHDAGGLAWRLVRNRCDHCAFSPKSCCCSGKQQVACVRHLTKNTGKCVSNCMEAKIPGLQADGNPVIWCSRLGASVLNEAETLVSKLPVWNEEFECLVLEFEGKRSVQASPQNFQLALPDAPDKVVCQYGQVGPRMFGLDFRRPLSIVQAFALALSASLLK